jgi:hypothetical protein
VWSPGGLSYSLLALRRLLPHVDLLPLAWRSQEDAPHFDPLLEDTAVLREGLQEWDGPGNHILLDCREDGHKPELAQLRLPPLPLDRLTPALGCSHLLLNCTSGRDLELETWRSLVSTWRARHPRGWLQLDWHSLSLDWQEGRARALRQVPRAFAWVDGLDLLQLTLEECASLTARPPRRLEDAADLTLRLRKSGCRRVVITDGARGFLFADAGGLKRQAAWPVPEVLDTTGCGDVLGAALLATLGRGWPVVDALLVVAELAARVCSGIGLGSLDSLVELPGAAPSAQSPA